MTRNKIPTGQLLLQFRTRRSLLCFRSTKTGNNLSTNTEGWVNNRKDGINGHRSREKLYELQDV